MQSFLLPQALTLRVGISPFKIVGYLILLLEVLVHPECKSHYQPLLSPLVVIGTLIYYSTLSQFFIYKLDLPYNLDTKVMIPEGEIPINTLVSISAFAIGKCYLL